MKKSNKDSSNFSDIQLLTELAEVCKTGNTFYSNVASSVENQALRNQLFSMSDLRSGIVSSLEHELIALNSSELTEAAIRLKHWYSEAPNKFSDFESLDFLNTVEDKERQYLSALRNRISRVRNQRYAKMLATKTASIQIMHDQLKQLKETFS